MLVGKAPDDDDDDTWIVQNTWNLYLMNSTEHMKLLHFTDNTEYIRLLLHPHITANFMNLILK